MNKDKETIENCPRCGGRGFYYGDDVIGKATKRVCPICFGTGRIRKREEK